MKNSVGRISAEENSISSHNDVEKTKNNSEIIAKTKAIIKKHTGSSLTKSQKKDRSKAALERDAKIRRLKAVQLDPRLTEEQRTQCIKKTERLVKQIKKPKLT